MTHDRLLTTGMQLAITVIVIALAINVPWDNVLRLMGE